MRPFSTCEMKCELCNKDFDNIARCHTCDTKFCKDCGDYDRTLCNDCIEFDTVSDGDIDDISE